MVNAKANGLSVLNFDGQRLAFSLSETIGIHRLSHTLSHDCEIPFALGRIDYVNRRWPVFGFDGRFYPLVTLPPTRTYCVCLSADQAETGLALACDSINTLPLSSDAIVQPLPICLQRNDSPLNGWYRLNGQLLPVSSVSLMANYFEQLKDDANA